MHENVSDFSDGHSYSNLGKTATAADRVSTKQSDDSCSKVMRPSPMPQSIAQLRFRQRTAEAEEASTARQTADAERSAAETEAHKRVA